MLGVLFGGGCATSEDPLQCSEETCVGEADEKCAIVSKSWFISGEYKLTILRALKAVASAHHPHNVT
jgi:hypothetical protein